MRGHRRRCVATLRPGQPVDATPDGRSAFARFRANDLHRCGEQPCHGRIGAVTGLPAPARPGRPVAGHPQHRPPGLAIMNMPSTPPLGAPTDVLALVTATSPWSPAAIAGASLAAAFD